MFKDYSDVVVQAILYEDKLTDFAGYSPLVLDVEMYQARNNAGKTQIAPLKVSDLDQEIQIRLPNNKEKTLTCAFYNEDIQDWESLKCSNEIVTDGHITCCTNHLTRFALVPAEYLEIATQKDGETIELSESSRGINFKYLAGCIIAFVTLVGTLLCLGK